jgi:hypothetical protein
MPPEWMWPLDEELERHFDRVKDRRRNPGLRDDDDDDESPTVIHNEYARGRGRVR